MATLEAGTTKKQLLTGTVTLKGTSGNNLPGQNNTYLPRNQQPKGEGGEGARICKDSPTHVLQMICRD